MHLAGLRTVAKAQNGVGAFVLQCRRIDIHYCDFWGSSRGMNDFIKEQLPKFAGRNPQVEFAISRRPHKHPVMKGLYINGREKAICVRNMTPSEILEKAELLLNASGAKLRRERKPVKSLNESVRGVWSPYHGFEHRV